ncbi:MAG TPA: hypothetical protein VHM24_03725, partial [Gemmatimonadaceae bacterium]|nr:hypothetical protein [Gemmatimonadaceae bacterium]
MSSISLRERIESAVAEHAAGSSPGDSRAAVEDLLSALEAGEVRAAERNAAGEWEAVSWVKGGILLGFQIGTLSDMSPIRLAGNSTAEPAAFSFFDKDTYPLRSFSLEHGVRIVPGGSSIRRGAFVAKGVVCMPPMYINVGAHI